MSNTDDKKTCGLSELDSPNQNLRDHMTDL